MKKIILALAFIFILAIGGFFYFRHQVYTSHGTRTGRAMFSIEKGEGNAEISSRLEKEGFIADSWYFLYYVRMNGLLNKIIPGDYNLSGSMTVPEIAITITNPEKDFVKITFPEGWTSQKMSERLVANGFDGKGFLEIVKNPGELKNRYAFLREKGVTTLEGYLFPDTYFFSKDATPEGIVVKMLENFNGKLSPEMKNKIQAQNKAIGEVVAMASIVENEVRSDEDRKIVSGLFWNRIKIGQPLQSCATLAYVLGENKKQYSFEDTRTPSPYNTYLNRGLPPGPISNPGISAIRAAIYPQDSQYNYFLSDPETGKTVFSKTIEEHNANKVKYGL